ncbi:MAG: thioredoxin domain-containing protein [Syntrophales bacterium]|nr:thioredoxin domain-containing protein [Syntrophales bacterium]
MIFYSFCTGSCDSLAGNLLGIDLKYVGICFMAVLIMMVIMNFSAIARIMLATALGGDLYLVGYQISIDTYCYYCLAFALMVLAAFLVNHKPGDAPRGWKKLLHFAGSVKFETTKLQEEKIMKWEKVLHPADEVKAKMGRVGLKRMPLAIFVLLGFALFFGGFSGSDTLVFAEEIYPSFGRGEVEVRLYSNYFCGPCSRLEPRIEPLLGTLVKANRIRLLFINMPFNQKSSEYDRYYLYAIREGTSFEAALRFRKTLFKVASSGIGTEKDLQMYLQRLGMEPKHVDVSPEVLTAVQYIRDDGITSTPVAVIVNDGDKHTYKGIDSIIEALKEIHK